MHGEPLAGRVAIVTGASQRSGIGCAVARRLLADGASVLVHGWGRTTPRFSTSFPAQRWGRPTDAARLVAWLVSDEAAWITGQVIDSEGGFRRWPT